MYFVLVRVYLFARLSAFDMHDIYACSTLWYLRMLPTVLRQLFAFVFEIMFGLRMQALRFARPCPCPSVCSLFIVHARMFVCV